MKTYDKEVFEKLILMIRNKDKEAEDWLVTEGYRELKEFVDACDGIENSFRWLLDNNYQQLAATVDAMMGNDPAKAYLLKSGNRELAAFVEATSGSQQAISWLLKYQHQGWVMVAKEYFDIDKKNEKSFIWNFLNFGNPFR